MISLTDFSALLLVPLGLIDPPAAGPLPDEVHLLDVPTVPSDPAPRLETLEQRVAELEAQLKDVLNRLDVLDDDMGQILPFRNPGA